MPIMAMTDQTDVRGPMRMMLSTVKNGWKDSEITPREKRAMNNLYRLLESYRAHQFQIYNDAAVSQAPELLSGLPPAQSNLQSVGSAICEALYKAYSNDGSEALDAIEQVLEAHYSGTRPEKDQEAKLSDFLDYLIKAL